MSVSIDLNADLGEHPDIELDAQIMPFLSSCNIACGGHAGDSHSVKGTIQLATQHQVAIGAHPAFPDRENFGRQKMDISPEDLLATLTDQILLVKELAEAVGQKLHHIKPHGALYNLAAVNRETASLIAELVLSIDPQIKLYGLSHSLSEKVALEKGVHFVGEAFADRRYEKDGTLRNRKWEDAVIYQNEEVLDQVEDIVCNGRVCAQDVWLPIAAQTICLHGDTKGAVNLAKSIHEHLVTKGVTITSVQ